MIKMRELIQKLNEATRAYDAGKPYMSDQEWDDLYFQLQALENETGIKYSDSPTQQVVFEEVSSLQKIKHDHPMLSLDKTKNIEDIEQFLSGHEWLGMFKMDGLTVSLTYEKGQLVQAETRGDGYIGEDILHNIHQVKNIPQTLPLKQQDKGCYLYDIDDIVVIDGEIICTYPNFAPFREEYKNPRNFAAGSIRLLNSKESAQRNLTFVAWDLVQGINEDFFFRRLEKLDDWGFTTVPRVGDAETGEETINLLNKMPERDLYPIDGYVFKFMSKSYGDSLGKTEHHFRNGIAYKQYDIEYETRLIDIEWSMGRTGVLSPVAIFQKIEIDGTEISRASLSNISIMTQTLGEHPFVGQIIYVTKRNMIIPKVERALDENGNKII